MAGLGLAWLAGWLAIHQTYTMNNATLFSVYL
jgi:hypothetical protein